MAKILGCGLLALVLWGGHVAQSQAQLVDQRDPARLSETFLQALLEDHDAETTALQGEIDLVWEAAREELIANSPPGRRGLRDLEAFDAARVVGMQNFADLRALQKASLEKQLAVAIANGGSAFGLVVPFFSNLVAVSDGRADASVPVSAAAEVDYYKPSNGIVDSTSGEFDLQLLMVGMDPANIVSVDFEITGDVESPATQSFAGLTVFSYFPPGNLNCDTFDNQLAASTNTDPEQYEQLILRAEATLRATITDVNRDQITLEGPIDLRNLALAPGPLSDLPVPLPQNIGDFISDQAAAVQLGKALFWDLQVSSNNQVACATCHNQAGVDLRSFNQDAMAVTPTTADVESPLPRNRQAVLADFQELPFGLGVGRVYGSQGVVGEDFISPNPTPGDSDIGSPTNGNVLQTTGRNSPTVINAAFYDRQFWDGRAARFFNGVNIFGEHDSSATVYTANGRRRISPVQILLDDASLASQAVGPVLSEVEMSWQGRKFHHVAQKLLGATPLVLQTIDPNDSVLAGLDPALTYADLIAAAFHPEWWNSRGTVTLPEGDVVTLPEANFAMFFGLAVMMYERTLISDQAPYDQWAVDPAGFPLPNSGGGDAQAGLELFLTTAKCIGCHDGPAFTSATTDQARLTPIEFMPFSDLNGRGAEGNAFYDVGFYNVGAEWTANDIGQGAESPFSPLSYTRQAGQTPDAVDGAFKTPTLRNVELTGPFLHNGRYATLEETVAFYLRGGDHPNRELHPDITLIELPDPVQGAKDIAAFMRTLTDPRVLYRRAPFDHPSLTLPRGDGGVPIVLEAVGAGGTLNPVTGFLDTALSQ